VTLDRTTAELRARRARGAAVKAGGTIVVGAAPVGLTAALALRSVGLPVTVVEAGGAGRVRRDHPGRAASRRS
jgi:NAD(P)H-nitrite reductase large subunit